MLALITLLFIIITSIIVVRIGAVALELTGLASEVASFQAQSAFSGVGFTTLESESIVSHPLRRRIIRILILLGSAGISTSMATLIIAFVGQSGVNVSIRAGTLLGGLVLIFLFARSKHIYYLMKLVITKALEKWTDLHIYDFEKLLGLGEGYTVAKVTVKPDSWMKDREIRDLSARLKGVLILAIYRTSEGKRKFIGAPHGDTVLRPDDELICYAKEEQIIIIF